MRIDTFTASIALKLIEGESCMKTVISGPVLLHSTATYVEETGIFFLTSTFEKKKECVSKDSHFRERLEIFYECPIQ